MHLMKNVFCLFALLPLIAAAQPAWINDGLVAYYPFDGDSKDASGNGQNLSNSNVSYIMDRFGVASSASFYSGNDSHSSATLAFPVKEKTFTGWVLLDNTQQKGGGAFGIEEAPIIGQAFDSVVYNERSQGWRFGSDNNVRGSDSGVFGDNTNWHHIVATYKENEFKMYMDGGIIDLTTAYKTKEFRENSTIRIGMRHSTGGGNIFLTAAIDDVRLYNRALSATEVAQLYEYESTPPTPKPIEEWIDDGLVAYYPFDGDASDESANDNNGNVVGAELGQDRFGQKASSFSFDGDDYVELPNSDSLSITVDSFTVSSWAKAESDFGRILAIKTGGNYPSKVISLENYDDNFSGKYAFYVRGPTQSNSRIAVNPEKHVLGLWQHIVASKDQKNNLITIWVDGKIVDQTDFEGDTSIDSNWFIGAKPNGGDGEKDYWKGQLDDIRFYNRALSATEVAQLYSYEVASQAAIATAQIVNGFVVEVDVLYGGIGYELPPKVRFVGGSPDKHASADIVLQNGSVIALKITNAGSGYKSVPQVIFDGPAMAPSLQISISAVESILPESMRPITAVATPEILNGFLVGATILNGGQGYDAPPFVTVLDNFGTGALATTTIEDGVVTGIRFVEAGIGYSDNTLLTLDSPPPNPDATPRVTEVELSMQMDFPNNYYTIEASADLANWQQIGEPFFANEKTHTLKVRVDDDSRYFRAIQQP